MQQLPEQKTNTTKKFVTKLRRKQFRKYLPLFALLLFFSFGVVATYTLSTQSTNTRSKAASKTGPVKLLLSPTSDFLTADTNQSIILNINTQEYSVTGVQVFGTISGDLPTDTSIVPATIPGLQLIASKLEPKDGNLALTLAYITQFDPNYTPPGSDTSGGFRPFSTDNQTIELARIKFFSPSSGNLNFAFDPILTKAEDPTSLENLIGFDDKLYTFATPTPTPVACNIPTSCNPDPVTCEVRCPVPTPPTCLPGQTLVTKTNECTCQYQVCEGNPIPSPTPAPTPITYTCNSPCTTDKQCQSADPSYLCVQISFSETVCRRGDNPSNQYCQAPTPPPTTPNPTPSNTPTPVTPYPTQSPTPYPTISPTPTPQPSETINVIKAEIDLKWYRFNKVTVEANSSLGRKASLSVDGLGDMKYSNKDDYYAGSWRTFDRPTYVTVRSNSGTTVRVPLSVK